MLVSIVPDNVVAAAANNGTILSLMFFAVMFGIGLVLTRTPQTEVLKRGIEGLFEISMTLIGLVIRLAPIAVFCFMFNLVSIFGFDLLLATGRVRRRRRARARAASVRQLFGRAEARRHSPIRFFKGAQEAMVMAFSTASSNATLPHRAARGRRELGLPRRISRFVLTVGATANQNGTALFEGVTGLFLAQFFGVDLSLGQQAMVMAGLHPRRHRNGRRAVGFAARGGADLRDGGRRPRRHRHDPGRQPLPRHVPHHAQRAPATSRSPRSWPRANRPRRGEQPLSAVALILRARPRERSERAGVGQFASCPPIPPRPPMTTPSRRDLANAIRFLAIDAVEAAKSGHPGMPMGMADIAEVLWNDLPATTRTTRRGSTATASCCPTATARCCSTRCCTCPATT
jgi:hypothetical protein